MEYDDNDDIINKPIIKQIEKILENEMSYYTSDDILRGIFQKFNITHDIIRDIIKSDILKKEKCDICYYISEYTNNKHILRCNSCNNINFCKECYGIIKDDWNNKYSRKNYTNKIIYCKICNQKLNIDVCKECEYK
jgi:hypothetical protein